MKELMSDWVDDHIAEFIGETDGIAFWLAWGDTTSGNDNPLTSIQFFTEDKCRDWLWAYIMDNADLVCPDPT